MKLRKKFSYTQEFYYFTDYYNDLLIIGKYYYNKNANRFDYTDINGNYIRKDTSYRGYNIYWL